MKLSKDEIEDVVGDINAALKSDRLRGPVIAEYVRRVLTRKFGERVNPYDGWRNIVRDYRGATPQTVSRVPVALAELVPELWDAAVKVDETRYTEAHLNAHLALHTIVERVKEAADGR